MQRFPETYDAVRLRMVGPYGEYLVQSLELSLKMSSSPHPIEPDFLLRKWRRLDEQLAGLDSHGRQGILRVFNWELSMLITHCSIQAQVLSTAQ
jgi:hypothetical protein